MELTLTTTCYLLNPFVLTQETRSSTSSCVGLVTITTKRRRWDVSEAACYYLRQEIFEVAKLNGISMQGNRNWDAASS